MKRFFSLSTPFWGSVGKLFLAFLSKTHLLILAFACIWMVFFDRYNLKSQFSMRQQIMELEQDKAFYIKSIEKVDYEYDKLYHNPKALEQYAREKYYMKRADEDVFVVSGE
jgi:cell division protein FtsB